MKKSKLEVRNFSYRCTVRSRGAYCPTASTSGFSRLFRIEVRPGAGSQFFPEAHARESDENGGVVCGAYHSTNFGVASECGWICCVDSLKIL